MIYGYWNPLPTMAFAVAVAVGLFWMVRMLQRSGRFGSLVTQKSNVHAASRSIAVMLTPPLARRFWEGVAAGVLAGADRARRIYTGNGQVYVLVILYYFIVLYGMSGS